MKGMLFRGPIAIVVASTIAAVCAVACGDDDNAVAPGGDSGTTSPDASSDATGNTDSPATNAATRLSRPSRGSGIDISEDDAIIVAVNRDVGSVSVFDVAYAGGAPTLTKRSEIQVCAEPWQVVLTPGADRAVVVCRKDRKLVRVDGIRGTAVKGPEATVGSEPTGVALTPKGTAAWVTNWMDGTLSEVTVETMAVASTVDLNPALVATNALGTVTARPALAHPRSIAITNNKDDVESDESIFVTEYFAQQKEALAPNGSNADTNKQGYVYKIGVKDRTVSTIPLPPIADIGIHDHNDQVAGCYPNQLQSIDVSGSFAYVTSICASPKGPLGDFTGPAFKACTADDASPCPGAASDRCTVPAATAPNGVCKTNCSADAECGALGGKCTNNVCVTNFWDAKVVQTSAVSVIDIGGNKVVASVSLNGEFDRVYNEKAVPDTSARRMPLTVTDLAFVPGTLNAYMVAKGSDAVYRVDFNESYQTKALDSVGMGDKQFLALDRGTLQAAQQGKLPIGIAMAHRSKVGAPERFAFVLNEASRNVIAIDLSREEIAGFPDATPVVASSSDMPTGAAAEVNEGKRLFDTGLGRWSLNGQAWGACESCHIDGLSDQVTWFHFRGVRQVPSLDQTISKKDPNRIRFNGWQAHADELTDHEAGALRSTFGAVGAIVKSQDLTNAAKIAFDRNGHAGLGGSSFAAADPTTPSQFVGEVSVLDDWKKIIAWQRTIRTPRGPSNLDPAKVAAGRAAFQTANCQGCHAGDLWTFSNVFYTPDRDTTPATNVTVQLKTRPWPALNGLPTAILPTERADMKFMRYAISANAGALDQMTCMIRNVGTFNVAEDGVGVAELRRNMTQASQGNEDTGRGFNVPSLKGLGVNAPYLHAGNARTLEAMLGANFAAHHGALNNGTFLGPDDPNAAATREALVQFLLSIDEETPTFELPALGPTGGDFCSRP